MKNIQIILISFFLFTSCGGLKEAGKVLRNEKIRTTDEFLIEKRGPLSIPPKMGELPKPKSSSEDKNNNTVISETDNQKEKSKLESILLEEIRKN